MVCRSELLLVALGLALSLIGCGGQLAGPSRYELSGAVTFDGKPVTSGSISFSPKDGEFGGGSATIRNGRYDTRDRGGRGHLGGAHLVQIFAEPPDDWDGGDFRPPFDPYEVERDLPAGSAVVNFEVPGGKKK